MKLGIALYGHPPSHIRAIVQRADALGFDIVWLGEHLLVPAGQTTPHPHRPHQDPPIVDLASELADPLVVIGALAATTARIRLATGVCVLPLRHPLLAARSVITAQQLAEGRVVLGVGAGWLEEEYAALGVPFHERGGRLDEGLAILAQALRGGVFAHRGKYHQFDTVQLSPTPVAVPIVVGGVTDPALRRAARVADGWYGPSVLSLEECMALRSRLEGFRDEVGTGDRSFAYYVRMPDWPTAARISRYADAGFDHVTISGFALWPPGRSASIDEKLRELDRASETLAPHLVGQRAR